MVAQASAVEAERATAVRRDLPRVLVQAEVQPRVAFSEKPADREAPAPITKAAARCKENSEACPPAGGQSEWAAGFPVQPVRSMVKESAVGVDREKDPPAPGT